MSATAKLFTHGRSQAVRLPKDFRFDGSEVSIRKVGRSVVLEPLTRRTPEDYRAIFEEIDRISAAHGPFMPDGGEQPPMPPDDDIASLD